MAVDIYISEEKIKSRIKELGEKITKDFKGEELVVIAVLNGSFIFCADLIREIKVPVIVEFVGATSYGESTESSGNVKITMDLKRDIAGKNILVVEDIVDTGLTLSNLLEVFKSRKPKSIKLASFLFKSARLKHTVPIDYLGFEIEDKFVIGYGLDFAGKYRELPYVGVYQG